MKLLRITFVRRTLAVFLLLVFVQSVFIPSYSWALTTGPHQPEYTSYEEPGATDIVNLLTGDFTNSLPLLEVPGPEGSFSMPLVYHSGIGLEEEASWVGLGWSMNAGAILRNINQYPDDASGSSQNITVQDLTGISSWSIQYFSPLRESWNSQTGFYGNINLLGVVEIEYGNTHSVGIAGIHVGDGGVKFDASQFVSSVMLVASLGTSAAGTSTAAIAKDIGLQLGMQIGISTAFAAFGGRNQGSSTAGVWEYSHSSSKSLIYNPKKMFSGAITGLGIKRKDNYWLDQTRYEKMYGVLYLDESPIKTDDQNFQASLKLKINGVDKSFGYYDRANDSGGASDLNFTIDPNVSYQNQSSPTQLATDSYSVYSPGIIGSINPYRLEVGSVGMPRDMTQFFWKLVQVPYLHYKVPFLYEGDIAGGYFHHAGGATSTNTPGFYYGLNLSTSANSMPPYTFSYNDYTFDFDYRVRPDASTKKLPSGKYVEWLSNDEILASTTYLSKYLDFLPAAGRSAFRNGILPGLSGKSIGAYCITGSNGMTYHFSLPIYEYQNRTEIIDAQDSTKKSIITRDAPFANTWLLTAITGPDFVDRNENGMADENDWGHWVKLNYGRQTDNYDWRMPYSVSETILDPTGAFKSYTSGKKQLYFLNSIETRSHIALFIKSNREDAKSVTTTINPLKLEEILLLNKNQYQNLISSFGAGFNYSDSYGSLCLNSQFIGAARTFVDQFALKRIIFGFDYSLCKNTTNAGGPSNINKGKLTLKTISVKGRNNQKIIPDYVFDYGSNPNYSSDKWDGWGMYNSTAFQSNHKSSSYDGDGAAWSLTGITTPLGSQINVTYERDTYSAISGNATLSSPVSYSKSNYDIPYYGTSSFNELFLDNSNGQFSVGDKVRLANGNAVYYCPTGGQSTSINYPTGTTDFVVASASADRISLGANYMNISNCSPTPGTMVHFDFNQGTLSEIDPARKGGNLRVSLVNVTDQGISHKTRYLYSNADGSSSGAVAQEPDYIKTTDFAFYGRLGYPVTPVMYSKVTLLTGRLQDDSDFDTRQTFEFVVPNQSQLTVDMETSDDPVLPILKRFYKITDNTAKIGSPLFVRTYNKSGSMSTESEFVYTDVIANNSNYSFQGIFSEGTLLSDYFQNDMGGTATRLNRTTVLHYPNALKKIITRKDGFVAESENLKWDLLSGGVEEKITRSSLGVNVKSVIIPAYRIYPEMGPKALDINNKNMISQIAGTYEYKTDAFGNSLGLIGANVQTWKNTWSNYRYLNGGSYVEGTDNSPGIWRVQKSYSWKGDYTRLKQDGTNSFSASDNFNFLAGASNPGWQLRSEIKRYDHFSLPIETTDMNNIYASIKSDSEGKYIMLQGYNASFQEVAFSSAEDLNTTTNYFGGEVALGSGSVVTSASHTGISSLQLSTGYGFVYKPTGLTPNRIYRVAVWSNSINGRIYYKLNGGAEQTSIAPTKQVGTWYLSELEIPVGTTFTSIEVGVKSAIGTVIFDDFRFQPIDAAMTGYVYKASTGELEYVLDNNNLYTRYEYNDRGLLIKTYSESIKYGVKLVSETKDNYKRFNTNQ